MDGGSNILFQQNYPSGLGFWGINFGQSLSNVTPNILFGILLIMGVLMGGVTIVLYYHWLRYGFGEKMVIFAQVLYTIVLVLAFIVMISSAAHYA
ncbi:MAG TPA: hypothetical protein VJI73_02570 [Candidatus Paceibacterota bacterium]